MRLLLTLILLHTLISCSFMSGIIIENDSNSNVTVSYSVFTDERGIDMQKVDFFGNDGAYRAITPAENGYFSYALEPGDRAHVGVAFSTTFAGYHHQCSNLNISLVDDCIPVEFFVFKYEGGVDSLRTDDLGLVLSKSNGREAIVSLKKIIK